MATTYDRIRILLHEVLKNDKIGEQKRSSRVYNSYWNEAIT